MKKTRLLSLALASAMMVGAAMPALATVSDTTKKADVQFTGGTSPSDFAITGGAPAFAFGTHAVKLDDMWYDETTTGTPKQVVITDNRGTGAGWRLTAKLGAFTTSSSQVLTGATVTLKNGAFSRTSEGSSIAPTVTSSVVLAASASSAETVVMSATPASGGTAGIGVNTLTWPVVTPAEHTAEPTASNIYLFVDGGTALVGSYEADMTWTLYNTP